MGDRSYLACRLFLLVVVGFLLVGGVGGCFLLESGYTGCFCGFMGILCR